MPCGQQDGARHKCMPIKLAIAPSMFNAVGIFGAAALWKDGVQNKMAHTSTGQHSDWRCACSTAEGAK
jgi:hypothetical protein